MLTNYNGEQPEEPEAEQPVQVSHEQTLLKFIKTKIEKKKRNNRVDAIVVLRQYFEKMNTGNDCNPLEYWKSNESDMPALANVARKALCVPATSTESERMFSKAGQTISDRRSALKPKIVDKLLFTGIPFYL
ncbi:zinc finger BED domain-containing protein 4-like [Drosophila obscura]|uniref:zinc finger BED domain-containing protein 4-like n=1 Tax=Drosophila obscura TaxID=7282 RepID=UPI001BB0ED23|nr:zinc finger BED domain-containing protein 4-like [Drosophila obscura]